MTRGRYANGQTYSMPETMQPVDDELLDTAVERALSALRGAEAVERMQVYYDPNLDYAGTSFSNIAPNDLLSVDLSDLYAVTRLSMSIGNRQSRLLLDPGHHRATLNRLLAAIPPDARLEADLSEALLTGMRALYDHVRTLLSERSNHWVFASKLCARKRPLLFPVRDSVVCTYLAGGPMGGGPRQMGWFAGDIQVLAYLIGHPDVRDCLLRLRRSAAQTGTAVDSADLRLFDAVVWMKGQLG